MTIRDYLKDQILLFDGAMGSYFASIHSDPNYPCEEANLTSPGTIAEIHRRYLNAGARAIKTNTFSLPREGEGGFSAYELIRSGYRLAKEQATPFGAYVFADMNLPVPTDETDLLPWYTSLVDVFLAEGATHFLFETCSSGKYLNQLAEHIKKQVPQGFILTSFAVHSDGFTQTGEGVQGIFSQLSPLIDGAGFNCVSGPRHMANLAQMVSWEGVLSAMPNASYPTVTGTRLSFGGNPSYFAQEMIEVSKAGCQILGGCCGTTPEYIAQLKGKLEHQKPGTKKPIPLVETQDKKVSPSLFYQKLMAGEKPIAVEWDSPALPEIAPYMAKAAQLKEAGADLLTIADCPVARPRMDSSLIACKLKRELGIQAMPHMTCRDRNINAAKALLLGLSVEAISDILIITGDPVPKEQRNEVKGVYEFNSRMLIHHISQLNHTLFPSPFYLYGALNINAVGFETQLRLAQDKINKGAVALFTQPVMSQRGFENLKLAKKRLSVPLVGGIFPATSHRNLTFLANEIPGFHVAPELMELYQGKTPEECSILAEEVSIKIMEGISPYVDGYYLVTPFQRTDLILPLIKHRKGRD